MEKKEKQYRTDQIAAFWLNEKKNEDGSTYWYYNGKEQERPYRKMFIYRNYKGDGDWKLMVLIPDESDPRGSRMTQIGILWKVDQKRMQGHLIRNKMPIIAWRSESKSKAFDMLKQQKNAGFVRDQEYHKKFEEIRKWPDLSIYPDTDFKKALNQQESIRHDIVKKEVKDMSEEKAKEIMEDIPEDTFVELECENDLPA